MSIFYLKFWAKESGNLMTHGDGLTKEQVEDLKSLKEGDRLIMWRNKRERDSDAHYSLKIYVPSTSGVTKDTHKP